MKTYIPERGSNILKYHAKKQLADFVGTKKVLDFGCGPGYWMEILREFGSKPIGVDISPDHVKICNQKGFKSFVGGVEYLLKFDSNSFDGILCSFVIEHLDRKEIDIMLKNFHRILVPNGILIINTDNWHSAYKKFFNDYTHKTPFTKTSITELVQSKGFKIKKFSYFPTIVKGFGLFSERFPFLTGFLYLFLQLDNIIYKRNMKLVAEKA